MQPTPEQQDILSSDWDTLIVAANAGAAKTTSLAFRIAEGLRRGIPPTRILSLTFTEPACRALGGALLKVGVPAAVSRSLWINTFEEFSAYVLRKLEGATVRKLSEPEELAPFVWEAVESLRADQERRWDDDLLLPAATHSDSEFVERFLRQRARMIGTLALDRALWDGERLDGDLAIELGADYTLLRLQRRYDELRCAWNADRPKFRGPHDATYDLARQLASPHHALDPCDIPGWPMLTHAVMVDEMHDMNRSMFVVLQAVLRSGGVFFCGVGDVDQVIHAADGAERYFMEDALAQETQRTVKTLPLTHTRRFGQALSDATGRFARKPYRSADGIGTEVACPNYTDADSCARHIAALAKDWRAQRRKMSEFAVLMRHAAQSVSIENALLDAEIPYMTSGLESYLLRPEVLLIRGLLAIASGRFDSIDSPSTRKRIVQEMVFFCNAQLDFDIDDDESQASRLKEAIRHVSAEPSNLRSFFEHQILKNAPPHIAARLGRALDVLREDGSAQAFERFLDALNIREWARETWVERQRQQDAVTHFDGLRQASIAFKTPQDFFASLNCAEIRQDEMRRKSSAFVLLASIPAVKGLEFSHVVIPFLDASSFPSPVHETPQDERSLFYVGITRARERLTLLAHHDRPSPFLRELQLG